MVVDVVVVAGVVFVDVGVVVVGRLSCILIHFFMESSSELVCQARKHHK